MYMLLQLPRCSMGLLLSASTTNCCWDSGSVGACCVDRGLCLVLLPLQLLLICLAPGTQQQGTQAAHQLPSPPCVSTILYFNFLFLFTSTRTDKMHKNSKPFDGCGRTCENKKFNHGCAGVVLESNMELLLYLRAIVRTYVDFRKRTLAFKVFCCWTCTRECTHPASREAKG